MSRLPRYLLLRLLICAWGCLSAATSIADWPSWRGPEGTGISRERGLPVFWNDERGIAWKCELPAWGTSTPAVWGGAIFVTSHTDQGKLLLLGISKRNGGIVWQNEVGQGTAPREAPQRKTQKFHRIHNLASPSPVTDGKTVVVHFGNGDLAAYDFNGNQLWKRNLQEDYGPYSIWWGHANSPIIYKDLVISVCMQDSLAGVQEVEAESYVVAHELTTGQVRWKKRRRTTASAEQCDSYTTPLLINFDGQQQLVIMGGNQLDARNPDTGETIWSLPGLIGGRTVTGPTFDDGWVFATRGQKGPLFALKVGEAGELSRNHIAWQADQGTPDTCTPVVWNSLLFSVTDDGVARCFDAVTGHLKWKKRLRGQYKASPVAAEGRIFFLNTEGLCTVVSASTRFDQLTSNKLSDETIASPAISGRQILIRGRKTLYCIGRG